MSASAAAGVYYATSRGQRAGRLAVIDVSTLPSCVKICNIGTQDGAAQYGLEVGSREFSFATQHREVLLSGVVPATSIKQVVDVDSPVLGIGASLSLRGFVDAWP